MADIDRRVASMRERREVSRSNFIWDDYLPALDAIGVDGHGHLFVYPTVPIPWPEGGTRQPPELRAVDVYAPGGELLFSGEIANVSWHAAHQDRIYSLEYDPDTGEQIVVGYRLIESFE